MQHVHSIVGDVQPVMNRTPLAPTPALNRPLQLHMLFALAPTDAPKAEPNDVCALITLHMKMVNKDIFLQSMDAVPRSKTIGIQQKSPRVLSSLDGAGELQWYMQSFMDASGEMRGFGA
jgi:hypothetical protein